MSRSKQTKFTFEIKVSENEIAHLIDMYAARLSENVWGNEKKYLRGNLDRMLQLLELAPQKYLSDPENEDEPA